MNSKTLEKLEYYKILEILSNFAITYLGKNICLSLVPIEGKTEIEKALKQTTEASILLYRKGSVPISEIQDITASIKKLNSNQFLSCKQLLELANILKVSSNLKDYYFSTEIDMSNFTKLYDLFNNLYLNKSIEKSVFSSIIDENTISDDASSNLKTIRRNIKSKEQEIKNKLNSLIHSKYVQDPVITMRSGRFVIPIKSEYRSEVKGFIHDISSSGSTVFIEPISVFDLNNELNNLKFEENLEIEKVLQKLSSLFFNIISEIENDVNIIGNIDFIFAKAKYSNSLDAVEPNINEDKLLDLKLAWHPLIEKSKAVKNDIIIGKDYNCLIITGPNTGGKTVTLKIAGLLTLMTLSGMHIPASEESSVFLCDNVFADIGDEQSIQDSLSTFSSHMTNISSILKEATSNSFVLLDELGSGTDPVEGSSLAISILENLKNLGAIVLSTTHYSELKHYALLNDGFENASVEFNLDTLSPTYKLLLGVPGTSNAFAISKKLGISETIINRAKEFINSDKISVEELLTNIYENKQLIEQEKEKILENSKKSDELRKSLEFDFSKLEKEKKEIINNAKDEARNILISAKDDANSIIKKLESTNSNKNANKLRDDLNEKIDNLKLVKNNYEPSQKIKKEDLKEGLKVYIKKLNQEGTISSISKDGKIQVQLDLGKMYFDVNELEISNDKSKSKTNKDYSSHKEFQAKSISSEINLIGQTVDEACLEIDKYLDNCYLAGLNTVRIVHGKGTGALRTGIQKFLKTHPHVKSYRVGTFGEGEMGVTVVELK